MMPPVEERLEYYECSPVVHISVHMMYDPEFESSSSFFPTQFASISQVWMHRMHTPIGITDVDKSTYTSLRHSDTCGMHRCCMTAWAAYTHTPVMLHLASPLPLPSFVHCLTSIGHPGLKCARRITHKRESQYPAVKREGRVILIFSKGRHPSSFQVQGRIEKVYCAL